MANKRMFSMVVVDTDAFLEMPLTTQALYFHLGMRTDDDGFVSSPKRIQKITGTTDDDFKLLIAKGFTIPFKNGVLVIRHFMLNNDLKNDRYHPTIYQKERRLLRGGKGKVYELLDKKYIQNGYDLDTEQD